MAILEYGDLEINGSVVSYESPVKIQQGSVTRNFYPQVNGEIVITNDISTNFSTITVNVRNTPENVEQFREYLNNGDNNTIKFRDQSYNRCTLIVLPEEQDLETVDYVFQGNPRV